MGTVVPAAQAAAGRLAQVGIGADVVGLTSPDLLYRAVRAPAGPQGRRVVDPAATTALGMTVRAALDLVS